MPSSKPPVCESRGFFIEKREKIYFGGDFRRLNEVFSRKSMELKFSEISERGCNTQRHSAEGYSRRKKQTFSCFSVQKFPAFPARTTPSQPVVVVSVKKKQEKTRKNIKNFLFYLLIVLSAHQTHQEQRKRAPRELYNIHNIPFRPWLTLLQPGFAVRGGPIPC